MTIRNLSDDARDRFAKRAERAGQSLQEYMRAFLTESAETPTVDEWLDESRAAVRGSGVHLSGNDYVAAVRSGRGID